LLQAVVQTSRFNRFAPDLETKRAAKQRFNAALVARREQHRILLPWYRRYLFHPAALAAMATVIIIAFVVFINVKTAVSPGIEYQVSDISPTASPNGNFAFLISDEVNAINDFDRVLVNISKIGIQQSDDKWIEIFPVEEVVDLTTVPGDAYKVIWQGGLPDDNYQQVFIYVDNVTGYRKGKTQAVEIKLPSQKLHMAIPFTISETEVTSFTYDLTVFATGVSKNSKYILKPQIGESGVTRGTVPTGKKSNTGNTIEITTAPVINQPNNPSKSRGSSDNKTQNSRD